MSSTIRPRPAIRRLDRRAWQASVLVADDARFPIGSAVKALVDVLEISPSTALALCQLIERHGEFSVWQGTPEGAAHNATRLRARGLKARVA